MGLVAEVIQEIVTGNGLRYPKLANGKYICFGGKMENLLKEFHDLFASRQCGRRRAQAEFESVPHHLPELHGGMIERRHR
jgi:hypothetical protein